MLRDLYLVLWKQLDLLAAESEWLEIAAASAPDLQERAKQLLDQIDELDANPELVAAARDDNNRVIAVIGQPSSLDGLARFATYLRDRALEFAQHAARAH